MAKIKVPRAMSAKVASGIWAQGHARARAKHRFADSPATQATFVARSLFGQQVNQCSLKLRGTHVLTRVVDASHCAFEQSSCDSAAAEGSDAGARLSGAAWACAEKFGSRVAPPHLLMSTSSYDSSQQSADGQSPLPHGTHPYAGQSPGAGGGGDGVGVSEGQHV